MRPPALLPLLLPLPWALSCGASPVDDGTAPARSPDAPTVATTPPPAPAFSNALAVIAADRRQFQPQADGVFGAHIPGVLTAELTREGLRATAGDDTLALRTVAVGRTTLEPVAPVPGDCAPTSEIVGTRCAPAAELRHAGLTEWWTSGPRGVQQGWVVDAPAGQRPGEDLVLDVLIEDGALERVDTDRAGATLRGTTGAAWRYEDLAAWDAAGQPLAVHLEDRSPHLRLRVDTRGADWPVTIDPLLGPAVAAQTELLATDGAAGDEYGSGVAAAGDIDGDGYPDLIVGARYDDDRGGNAGAAYVYYGTATGISSASEHKLTASDGAGDDRFGDAVAGGFDIDGDGYDDVVVGAWRDDDNGSVSGSAYVYYGSATGISSASERKLIASDGAASDFYGLSLGGGGDLDGDGYDDIAIGAYGHDATATDAGSVYVYYGTATGISVASELKLTASDGAAGDRYGAAVAVARDLDGDGTDDLLVGAYYSDGRANGSGSAYVYYGSASGVSAASEVKLTASDGATTDLFGYALATAGDLDGDGYGDLLIGAYGVDDAASGAGAAYVYYGSASGVSAASEQKVGASDGATNDFFGVRVHGGQDLDGDGYDDVVVAAPYEDDLGAEAGALYVFYGSVDGLDASSERKLTAREGAAGDYLGLSVAMVGDLDGDGDGELAAGGHGGDANGSNSGGVVVFSQRASLVATDGGSGDAFGYPVSAGGDIDGDGFDDIVVGARFLDGSASNTGAAFVYYGSALGIDPSSEDRLEASDGAGSDYFGQSLGGGGDLNGDGYDDLVIGAYADDDEGAGSGSVYVYYGSSSGILASTEVKLTASDAASRDYFGERVAIAGDLDGDGYDDLVVGAERSGATLSGSGSAYVYYGSSTGIVAASEDKLVASDAAAGAAFGTAVAGAGDVDGDGYDDLIIGSDTCQVSGAAVGAAYVYFGSSTGVSASSETKLAASDGEDADRFGVSVAGAGDVDGDGHDDVIVGAYAAGDGGAAYVYFGAATGISVASEQRLQASDAGSADQLGISVAGAGDLDGDGYSDVLVGADLDDDAATDAGAAYVWFGSATGVLTTSEQKLTRTGASSGEGLGASVAGAGDVNGDGMDDLVIGAPGADLVSSDAGLIQVYTGGCRDGDGDGACSDVDCDDGDADIHPDATDSVGDGVDSDCDGVELCYVDADDDGHPLSTTVSTAASDCMASGEGTAAELAAVGQDDCDDTDATVNPGATDAEGDVVDADCDGMEICYVDGDDDGSPLSATVTSSDSDCADSGEGTAAELSAAGQDDCDDADATVSPGATEDVGDGVDQDCDGREICYQDVDDDGAPTSDTVASADSDCADPGEGTAAERVAAGRDDCDDADSSVHPGATDVTADGVDSDCDGVELCYADADDDGYTDESVVTSTDTDCSDKYEATRLTPTGDCDDSDARVNPGATEAPGDGVDGDCDGAEICYVDADDDGYPDFSQTVVSADTDCADPGEGAATDRTGECDDGDASVHPGATEAPGDAVDSDCDGTERCFVDADGDGYTSDADTVASADLDCADPGEASAALPTGDCDDGDASVSPAATEEPVGDGVDQDCDGVEICYADADDDGYPDFDRTVESSDTDCRDAGEGAVTDPTGECDDSDARVHPGAPELADDGVDNDGDGEERVTETDDGDTDDPVADSPSEDDGKGGCSTVAGPARGWLLLAGALALIRRRRLASGGEPVTAPTLPGTHRPRSH